MDLVVACDSWWDWYANSISPGSEGEVPEVVPATQRRQNVLDSETHLKERDHEVSPVSDHQDELCR